jgi:hypothetical protein
VPDVERQLHVDRPPVDGGLLDARPQLPAKRQEMRKPGMTPDWESAADRPGVPVRLLLG